MPSGSAGTWSWSVALFAVILAATVVVAPMFFLGNASGHDIEFHIASWMDVAGQWPQGIAFPRWAEWANWGFGEPRFIFYPPGSWMAGAALGSVLPWRIVPGAFIWLALIAAGMAMWRLAREWMPGPQAAAAAIFFAVNPYNLVIVYYRSDYAELAAIALLPLAIWAGLRTAREGWRRVPALAIVFAGIWLLDAPEGVIAAYTLALLFIVESISQRSLRPLVAGGAAMAAGLGLAGFYILPAAWEQRWVQIVQAVSGSLDPRQSFLFAHSDDPDFQLFNLKVSRVAVGMLLAAVIAAVLAARKRRDSAEIWRVLALLGAACGLLMFPVSLPLWRHLPKLEFVQFPWRWLGPLGVVFAFFTAAAMNGARRKWVPWVILAIVLGAIGATGRAMVRDAWWDSQDAPFLAQEIASGRGYEGVDEYMPLGCDRTELPGNPNDDERAEDVSSTPAQRIEELDAASGKVVPAHGIKLQIDKWSAERKAFAIDAPAPVTLALRLLNYPAWEVRVDGMAIPGESADNTAQLLVPVPAGRHRVEVRFSRTWDRTAGAALSLICAGGLFVFAAAERRREGRAKARGA
ncbi:MAG: 6-pyruvoyl-tetrahydropterin synthase-related protein [Candidatus Acidiferrales bacterium]